MGVADVCPYCGADNKKVSLKLKRAMARAEGGKTPYPVTMGFVIVNVFMYVLAIAIGGLAPSSGVMSLGAPDIEFVYRLGLMYPPAIAAGDWWRLVTPVFLHLGVLHVFFNTYILWVAGRHVEEEVGPRLMFFVYMATGILGFVASYATGTALSGGASGAVSGLLGFVLVRRRLVDGDFRNPITMWIIQLIVLTAIFGLVVARVDNAAHVGGIVPGAAIAWLLTRVRLSKAGAVGLMLLTTGLAVVTVVAGVMMGLSLTRGSTKDVDGVTTCMVRASNALTLGGLAVDAGRVQDAITCFSTTGSLGGQASDAREEVISQLKVAADAHARSDTAGEQDATRRVMLGVASYRGWLDEHWMVFFPPPNRIVDRSSDRPLSPDAEASPMREGQRERRAP
jgi:membrane associated rhomboid family serine protease